MGRSSYPSNGNGGLSRVLGSPKILETPYHIRRSYGRLLVIQPSVGSSLLTDHVPSSGRVGVRDAR